MQQNKRTVCSKLQHVNQPLKLRLHVRYFYSHRQHNTSFSCGRVCETKTLHLEPVASSATKSLGHCCRIFIELNFCSIEDTVTGYMSNHFRLLSQNSFVDVELPVRVENRRCSRSLIHQNHYYIFVCNITIYLLKQQILQRYNFKFRFKGNAEEPKISKIEID